MFDPAPGPSAGAPLRTIASSVASTAKRSGSRRNAERLRHRWCNLVSPSLRCCRHNQREALRKPRISAEACPIESRAAWLRRCESLCTRHRWFRLRHPETTPELLTGRFTSVNAARCRRRLFPAAKHCIHGVRIVRAMWQTYSPTHEAAPTSVRDVRSSSLGLQPRTYGSGDLLCVFCFASRRPC